MMGISKRSRGCQTCRRRRVKCDEVRPSCDRCAKSKVECEGYEKHFRFVDERSGAERRVRVKREAYLEAWKQEMEASLNRHPKKPSRPTVLIPQSPSPPPRYVPQTALDNEKLSFMLSKFGDGAPLLARNITDLLDNEPNSTTLYGIKALSMMFYGRIHKDQYWINMGMQSYCTALRHLRDDLQNPKGTYSVISLRTIDCMSMFELMASPTGFGIIGHMQGLQRMCKMLGTKCYRTAVDLETFEMARQSIMYSHIEQKERCFLAEPEWLTLPWQTASQPKSLRAQLYDRFAHVPGILADIENLKTRVDYSIEEIDRLAQDVDHHILELCKWRAIWESRNPSCCTALPFHLQQYSENLPPNTFVPLRFTDLQIAREYLLYNTTLLLLHRIRIFLTSSNYVPTPSFSPHSVPFTPTNPLLLSPHAKKSLHEIGSEICACLDYMLLDSHVVAGSMYAIYPLRVAFEIYEEGSWGWNYISEKLVRMADVAGIELGRGIMPNGLLGRLMVDEEGGLREKARARCYALDGINGQLDTNYPIPEEYLDADGEMNEVGTYGVMF